MAGSLVVSPAAQFPTLGSIPFPLTSAVLQILYNHYSFKFLRDFFGTGVRYAL